MKQSLPFNPWGSARQCGRKMMKFPHRQFSVCRVITSNLFMCAADCLSQLAPRSKWNRDKGENGIPQKFRRLLKNGHTEAYSCLCFRNESSRRHEQFNIFYQGILRRVCHMTSRPHSFHQFHPNRILPSMSRQSNRCKSHYRSNDWLNPSTLTIFAWTWGATSGLPYFGSDRHRKQCRHHQQCRPDWQIADHCE
jgi:hypothetical protein